MKTLMGNCNYSEGWWRQEPSNRSANIFSVFVALFQKNELKKLPSLVYQKCDNILLKRFDARGLMQ